MAHRKKSEFVHAVDVGNGWLAEVKRRLGVDRHTALKILGAVLHTFRDRLEANQIAHLGNQLPLIIRGLLYDQWRPGHPAKKIRKEAEFLAIVSDRMPKKVKIDVRDAVKEVFGVLAGHPTGEILKIVRTLPSEIRALATPDKLSPPPDSSFDWE